MRKVVCCKYKEELEGLERAPLPGYLGQKIYENVSKRAWEEWQDLQIKMINEYRLNLANREDYEALVDQMLIFLCLKHGESFDVEDPERGGKQ
ncbi:MAG: oxidative damage protection protein [Deltaproteobacteria bacterium]|nr:oxidative damage protection protein [Deltaproteobacteria bacterium]